MPMRKRKEVQEVLRRLRFRAAAFSFLALLAFQAGAAVLPEQVATLKKASSQPLAAPDPEVWKEFGFEEAEEAVLADGPAKVALSVWRFADSTGAYAAFEALRPTDATPSPLAGRAVRSGSALLAQHGNYILRFVAAPEQARFAAITAALPKVDRTSLPGLGGFLPAAGRVPNSERFVLGPASLARFEPRVPAATAAFDFGTEAQVAQYRLGGGSATLALFSYPNPQIARRQFAAFEKLPGAMAKWTGVLVAVVFGAPNPDEAERLLAQVRYGAQITWNERMPSAKDNVGDLLLNIFILCGILICLFIAAGVVVGLLRRAFSGRNAEPMILLRLDE